MADSTQQFTTIVAGAPGGSAYIDVPFDPDEAWGKKETHHVTGAINGCNFRGPLVPASGTWRLSLGPAWRRDKGIEPGDEVDVVLTAEGPQRDSLPADLVEAFDGEPEAGAFYDSLATFYRKGYLRWLEGAARRPVVREERVRELVALLKAGKKSRD